ncbi:DNA mismatch repair protein Msh1 [Saitoella complicata NRRL Y-17804]|uniref:DNA mismatch repair protein Msh1 n=1 Tax=Saitoella complicata (strain BCRC 22490 / CBS 7301 / JCM 7358 / NBRC 10748 / NRRL Y-17804) TaxID=698492 RepID=UPI000867B443|nr:DNA mismatch repair protein Msh1 [Saitoella complicata NRRL Y-17804]ODQ52398.1 DNA mismatch repair protein Msh1 [Saitoella complicata NRRL Y-17804]
MLPRNSNSYVLSALGRSQQCLLLTPNSLFQLRPHVHPCLLNNQQYYARRGAKRVAKVSVSELPQGHLAPLEPLNEPLKEKPVEYPFYLRQVLLTQQRFPKCVVLMQVGGFFELYFHQAEEIGPLLNLKVAQRDMVAGPVAMAGFPLHQLDKYLKILVQDLEKYVALIEQVERPESELPGGKGVDRRVTRVITPGTLIDEKFMHPWEHNYLLAIDTSQSKTDTNGRTSVGIAWLDLSTGDFHTQTSDLSVLTSELARIGPREILIDENLRKDDPFKILDIMENHEYFMTYEPFDVTQTADIGDWGSLVEMESPVSNPDAFTSEEVAAGTALLRYVKERLQGSNAKLQTPVRRSGAERMLIDVHSLRALEIKKSLREGTMKGSLLNAIKRTTTMSGARLLTSWLSSPLTDISQINARLDLVDALIDDTHLKADIIQFLREAHDSHRIVQKFSLGRGEADDMLALARTITASEGILQSFLGNKSLNDNRSVKDICSRLSPPLSLAKKILSAIDEYGLQQKLREEEEQDAEMLVQAKAALLEGEQNNEAADATEQKKRNKSAGKNSEQVPSDVWIMKKTASIPLKRLHTALEELYLEKAVLITSLIDKTGAKSLTLRFSPSMEYFVHVRQKDAASVASLENTKLVGTSKSTRSIQHPEWTYIGTKIDQTKDQIRAAEIKTFQKIRKEVLKHSALLRRNGRVLDELDVACSFATLARERDWVRPVLNNSTEHRIVAGRHPIVEAALYEKGTTFVANDCFMEKSKYLWVITGPNMGGKSTYLRQNAVITILAQVGSYVPAQHAEIGVVDQIFSRVGSADDLFRHQSTFLVEMIETAAILRNATPRSLVIMDEVGRGTTSWDGLAIAYACLHRLHNVNKCRTLFATHFHELGDMIKRFEHAGGLCTELEQHEDGWTSFSHEIKEGVCRQSHGIHVAQLAGLPNETVELASKTLQYIQSQNTPIVLNAEFYGSISHG